MTTKPIVRACHPEVPTPVGAEGSQLSVYRGVFRYGRFAKGCCSALPGGFAPVAFCGATLPFGAAVFPTVKYLRIFSSRFGPSPRIASKSSTLLNGPYDLRICRIFSAVAGPIPGTCCNSCDVAVLRLTGLAGGFFFAGRIAAQKMRLRKRKEKKSRTGNNRGIMARP